MSNRLKCPSTLRSRVLASIAVSALAAPAAAQAGTAPATGPAGGPKPPASTTLEQCLTQGPQAERSATFVGEMSAIPGSVRLEMRIEVLERLPNEVGFHTVTAPGLGVWRASAAGVRIYRYLKQVTDLSGPAVYRASVRFRWVNAKSRTIRSLELLTPRCDQPAPPSGEPAVAASQAAAAAPSSASAATPPVTPSGSAG